jgi:hypothetical protein
MRGTMFNSNKFEYASIKYIGTDDYIMKKVSIKLGISLKNFFKKFNITGKESYNPILIPMTSISNESYQFTEIGTDDVKLNEEGLRSNNSMIIFDSYFNEADNNSMLKKILYPERIKNQKDILSIYDIIKKQIPMITYTKLNIPAYKKNNVFVIIGICFLIISYMLSMSFCFLILSGYNIFLSIELLSASLKYESNIIILLLDLNPSSLSLTSSVPISVN